MPSRLPASFTVLAALALASPAFAQAPPRWPPSPHVAATEPLTPEQQRARLKLPPGFEIQLVAAEPDVVNPMNLQFDAKGRLWVTTSREYPFPAKGTPTRDAVQVLGDFGPDGRARQVTTFAADLNIPIGVLPVGQGAIVHSIPNVWLLEDADGDGKADKKEVLLREYGYKDTHGMTGEFMRGFDGRVYACHGFSNTSTVTGRDGSSITMTSGNTYRFRPDGTQVEYFTHGQVNPFGLAFDPLGNLFSTDCHTRPIYQLLRGAWYPSFGKPHDGLGFGPEMMKHQHGSTAIAGIAYYAADHFPPEYRGNVFVGNVVTNRVNRDSLKRHGSTLLAVEQPDLVVSEDPWFRPVDVKLGPDGALYIADFYDRIIGHYEVPLDHPGRDRERGRIWRVVYKGQDGQGQPAAPRADWTTATVARLIDDLSHPNLTVRLTATHQLADRDGKEVVPAVREALGRNDNTFRTAHSLWVLHRQGALKQEELVRAAGHADPLVRVHAQRILTDRAELPDDLREVALHGLEDRDAFVQRAAAEALGAHPRRDNLPPLLALLSRVAKDDTHLRHVVRMALRDTLRPPGTLERLAGSEWPAADEAVFADVCVSLPSAEAAGYLLARLDRLRKGNQLTDAVRHVARHGGEGTAEGVLAFVAKHHPRDPAAQARLAVAFHQGTQERGAALPDSVKEWAGRLCGELLAAPQAAEVNSGLDVATQLKLAAAAPRLRALLADAQRPVEQRGKAAAALVTLEPTEHALALGRLLTDGTQPTPLRQAVADALAAANRPETRAQLVAAFAAVPADLQTHVAKVLVNGKEGAELLLDAIQAGKASPRLLQNLEVAVRLKFVNPPRLEERLAELRQGLPPADEQLATLIRQRAEKFHTDKADAGRGAELFRKHCAVCHQLNNEGAKFAPQLDGVGVRGTARLLEDVLDPGRNVDQAFRATVVEMKDGRVLTGLQTRQEGNVVVLVDGQGKEVRLSLAEIEDRRVGQMSPMPATFGEHLPEADLHDLLAFLLRQRPPAGKQIP